IGERAPIDADDQIEGGLLQRYRLEASGLRLRDDLRRHRVTEASAEERPATSLNDARRGIMVSPRRATSATAFVTRSCSSRRSAAISSSFVISRALTFRGGCAGHLAGVSVTPARINAAIAIRCISRHWLLEPLGALDLLGALRIGLAGRPSWASSSPRSRRPSAVCPPGHC